MKNAHDTPENMPQVGSQHRGPHTLLHDWSWFQCGPVQIDDEVFLWQDFPMNKMDKPRTQWVNDITMYILSITPDEGCPSLVIVQS